MNKLQDKFTLGHAFAYLAQEEKLNLDLKNQLHSREDEKDLDSLRKLIAEFNPDEKVSHLMQKLPYDTCVTTSAFLADNIDFFILMMNFNNEYEAHAQRFLNHINNCFQCFEVFSEFFQHYYYALESLKSEQEQL